MRPKTPPTALSRNVVLSGFTSFFTDVSSEMIYPLLQGFLAQIMAQAGRLLGPVLGLIEGIAEATAALTKLYSGRLSDRLGKRKLPAVVGYAASALAKLALLLASAGWVFVLVYRFLDRVGKGVRGAPRDALIVESIPPNLKGRAFGFTRAMDFAGATLGTIIAFFLVRRFLDPATGRLLNLDGFFMIFAISVIPAFLGVAFLLFAREAKRRKESAAKKSARFSGNAGFLSSLKAYDKNLKLFFLAQAIFTLGNSSNQFLLLRTTDLVSDLSITILMYLAFNLATTLFASFFGSLSDRLGRKKLLIAGYALYTLVYGAFGFISREWSFLLWGFWPLYGLYYALTEGVEKAFVADLAPAESRATALGLLAAIEGAGLLPASLLAGLLYYLFPGAPYLFGSAASLAALFIFTMAVREKHPGKRAAA